MKGNLILILLLFCGINQARAIEYNELGVYPYKTASLHELEIENSTSASSDDQPGVQSRILRSAFEINYGISDRIELAAYVDYQRLPDERMQYKDFRFHARTYFYEKGELPVDFGAYIEVELPKDSDNKDMAFELKPILEKDFSKWTLSLNPQIEFEHQLDEKDPNATAKTWQIVFGLSTSIAYRLNESFKPHLDLFEGFTDQDALLMPACQVLLINNLKLDLGLGFGLNDKTEKRIANVRLEYEVYF